MVLVARGRVQNLQLKHGFRRVALLARIGAFQTKATSNYTKLHHQCGVWMALTFWTSEVIALRRTTPKEGTKCRLIPIKGAMKWNVVASAVPPPKPPHVCLIHPDTTTSDSSLDRVGASAIGVEFKRGIWMTHDSIDAIFTAFPITRPRSGREIYQTKQNSQAQEGHGFQGRQWQIKTGLEHKNSRSFVGNTSSHG